jgi:hypothetical protein
MAGLSQQSKNADMKLDAAPRKILCDRLSDLLQAALDSGPESANAYRRWRSEVSFANIDFTAFRLLPLLVETIVRHNIDEPELRRIRGAAKQAWLKNVTRAHRLTGTLDVLTSAGVKALVMKGAALFARYSELISMRGCGDYDILVRRRDAPVAVQALLTAGFQVDGVRMDLFVPSDFEKIHGMHFAMGAAHDTVDVHWWPLPGWWDDGYVDGLFSRAEYGKLLGHTVMVPRLDDHLFLSTQRISLDDEDEILLRTMEAALLLRACDGRLNWRHFAELTDFHHGAARAAAVFQILERLENIPMPIGIAADLRAAAARQVERPAWTRAGERVDKRELWWEYAAKETTFSAHPIAFLHGFSFPETLGRWTDGRLAAVAMQVNVVGPVSVALEVRPFLPPGASQFSFSVFGGADADSSFTLCSADNWVSIVTIQAIALPVPPQRAGAGLADESGEPKPKGLVILAFELMDAGCPMELGLSTDPRRLGLLVGDIRLVIGN